MKTQLTWLPVSLIVLTVTLFSPVKEAVVSKKTVEKTVSFSVFKNSGYDAAAYNNTSAQVYITVVKVSENKRTLVWDTVIDAKMLKEFPTAENAFSQTVTVPGLSEKKEHLEIKYVLTYDSKGSQLQMQDWIVASEKNNVLNIGI